MIFYQKVSNNQLKNEEHYHIKIHKHIIQRRFL